MLRIQQIRRMMEAFNTVLQYNQYTTQYCVHDYYKAITLTHLTQSACKFCCSEFRSKLSVPQTVSVQEQKMISLFEIQHRQRGKLTLVEALPCHPLKR